MNYKIYEILGYFILYSFFGWCFESTVVSVSQRKFVNRGFLSGPVCPIYAVGALSVLFVLYPIKDNLVMLYLGGALLATVIEYIIGWGMETIFKTRWWDYSSHKYQFQGRICLTSSIAWGFLSVVMFYFIHPQVEKLMNFIPDNLIKMLEVPIFAYFITDLVITVRSVIDLNIKLESIKKVKEEIHEQLLAVRELDINTELKERINMFVEKIEGRLPEIKNLEFMEEIRGLAGELRGISAESNKRFNELLNLYKEKVNVKSLIQKRFLKAYPNIKSSRFNEYLSELKEKLKKENN